jgi:hypothetical protein
MPITTTTGADGEELRSLRFWGSLSGVSGGRPCWFCDPNGMDSRFALPPDQGRQPTHGYGPFDEVHRDLTLSPTSL